MFENSRLVGGLGGLEGRLLVGSFQAEACLQLYLFGSHRFPSPKAAEDPTPKAGCVKYLNGDAIRTGGVPTVIVLQVTARWSNNH